MVAKRLLEQREGDIAQGKIPGIHFDKVNFDELAEDFLTDYKVNGKDVIRAEISVRRLIKVFGGMRAPAIDTPKINRYIEHRLQEGAPNSTINRELSALKRMFNLGAKNTPSKVAHVPYIPMLKENNVRKGFFEHGEFLALENSLTEYLRGLVTFAYKTGWRISEICALKWAQVDRKQGIVRLEPGETKNDEGRTVYLDDELREVFNQQWERRKELGNVLPYVFLNANGTDRIKRFDKAWETACRKAGIRVRLFHDFRRTAVRNMVRAGIPERVAMTISGHKTRSVFERYNIVSDADLKEAARRQAAYLDSQAGTISGTIGKVVSLKPHAPVAQEDRATDS